ncbi:MAG: hypothetical protein ACI89J_003335 [Hyphomicrobiaceae bacterium]|jgi:hypothetical protein
MKAHEAARAIAIRNLNDKFRQALHGGSVLFTAGIMALGPDTQARILTAVQTSDFFDEGDDPWGEHDFGALEIDGERMIFKIDYYDLTRAMHSEDPTDPTTTERVMTIMLAREY